ncbi:DUF2474 family protein [Jeongeupia naejangsanensis]|uniref:DUF2474 family protein n=1 Tax=Jeongeupia naejangsanensis TaxID=613195 RepID=A0ABS2BMJ8_9NEIS|nr:DUF2474 family protein [Jeongeupia naejangsanensis]MBM3116844.1 DUF2474 family protein [Jeongeupia naejangsanensis]
MRAAERRGRWRGALWFVGLWLAGVLTLTLVAGFFRLLMRWAG